MSPPKVSLAGKDVPKPVEVPAELEVSTDAPSVITVDESCERHRHIRKAKKARWICCSVTFLLIAALGVVCIVGSIARLNGRHHHKKHHDRKNWSLCYGTKRLNENVIVDHNNKLIKVNHDYDQETHEPAMEILHEYKRGMVAYKDMDKKICYIDRLDETFVDGYERWETYEKLDRKDQKTLQVISQPIEVEVMRHFMDIHITYHCRDATSHWVMEIDEKKVTTEMRLIRV